MKTHIKPIICCVLGLSLHALSPVLRADDKDQPAATLQAEIDALKMTKETLRDKGYPRDEATEEQMDAIKEKIRNLEKRRDEGEMSLEEKAENKEELYQGNANHARDMIKAESEALRERIEKASEGIDEAQESCTKAGYDTLKSTESFTYDQKRALVAKFAKEAAMTLASLDQAAQDMIYTYDDARDAMTEQKADPTENGTPEKEAVGDNPPADETVTENEEDTYEGNANHARDLIKVKADAIRKELNEAATEIEKAEAGDIAAAYAKLKADAKFPYEAKYVALNGFKEDAADALMSLHKDACEMLAEYKDETSTMKRGAEIKEKESDSAE